MLLSGFIAAVVLDKAHNVVRKGFPASFAEMDMNVKGRAADVLHKVGFGGQRGNGCGGAGLAGFIVLLCQEKVQVKNDFFPFCKSH